MIIEKMKINVIGLGKLGLPFASLLAQYYDVYGIDNDKSKIDKISRGICPIIEPEVDKLILNRNLKVTTQYKKADITFIIVPTPSEPDGSFSNQFIDEALNKIKSGIIVIVSTVMPRTCEKRVTKYREIIYNPVFIALGSVIKNLIYSDFILIGKQNHTDISILKEIYKKIGNISPIITIPFLEAEITKLALNCYITMKITFANHLDEICGDIADTKLITETIGLDSRIGNKYITPGLGYGGPCFPRDNRAFVSFAKSLGKRAEIAELVHKINERQVERMIRKINKLRPNVVGFESLSYKPNYLLTEESQLLKIYEECKRRGYKVKLGEGDITLGYGGIK